MEKQIKQIKKQGGSVVMALQYIQEQCKYLPEDKMMIVAEVFGVSPAQVYGVATFYHQFTFKAKGKHIISVCMGTACYIKNSEKILKDVEAFLGIKAGGITSDGMFSIEHNTRCVGDCANAPVVVIDEQYYKKATSKQILEVLNELKKH